jgi:DNA polymerase III alpha subunit (gram-positive type)
MSHTKKWNEILPETNNILNINLKNLIENYLDFKNKNLIFFDLETLGFSPSFEYEQIIEIASMYVCGDTYEKKETYRSKVELLKSTKEFIQHEDSVERYNWEKRQRRRGKSAITSPDKILEFTKYYELNCEYVSEKTAIENFLKFIDSVPNPILIAHNTDFDINYLITRSKKYAIKTPTFDVLDTLKVSKFFFIPTLRSLSKNPQVEKILSSLSRYQVNNKNKIHFSSRLGDLANALDIDATGWHTANADVQMAYKLLGKMISIFKENISTDIEKRKKTIYQRVGKK